MHVKILLLPFGDIDANLLGSRYSPAPMPLGLRTRPGGFLPLKRLCVSRGASRLGRPLVSVLHGYEHASIDTTLIPSEAQYDATRSNAGKGNPSKYAAFATPCTSGQRLSDHS